MFDTNFKINFIKNEFNFLEFEEIFKNSFLIKLNIRNQEIKLIINLFDYNNNIIIEVNGCIIINYENKNFEEFINFIKSIRLK